jgi:hypothetical protein
MAWSLIGTGELFIPFYFCLTLGSAIISKLKWLRLLVVDLSPGRPEFNPTLIRVGLVNNLIREKVLLRVLGFLYHSSNAPYSYFIQALPTLLILSATNSVFRIKQFSVFRSFAELVLALLQFVMNCKKKLFFILDYKLVLFKITIAQVFQEIKIFLK